MKSSSSKPKAKRPEAALKRALTPAQRRGQKKLLEIMSCLDLVAGYDYKVERSRD